MSAASRRGDDGPGTGDRHELRLGGQRAVVSVVGAALRSYAVADRDVIVPFTDAEIAPLSHGEVLLPWPNRIRDGLYTVDGVERQLPLSEPARRVALHGLVREERWATLAWSAARVTLGIDLRPTPGYPFPLRTRISYELMPSGLDVTLDTVNTGTDVAPYGVGFHPWLSPGNGALDECTLRVDAREWVRTDERLLPIGREPIPAAIDFRAPRVLGDCRLDDAFVEATHAAGRSWVRLTGTDGKTAAVWMGDGLTCWQLYTGDGIPTAARVRAGLAAEPMTCVADAFRTGDDLVRLAPGQRHTVRWGIVLLED